MKSLKVIQVLAKIAKILSKIVFICCVVAFGCCAVGMICLALGGYALKFGGLSLEEILLENGGMTLGAAYASMTSALFILAGEAVIAKFAEAYFANELKAGTPFTVAGANEMLRLGILEICISLGAVILAAIAYGIFIAARTDVAAMPSDLGNSSNVATGIVFILFSVVFRYGAEICNKISCDIATCDKPVCEKDACEKTAGTTEEN